MAEKTAKNAVKSTEFAAQGETLLTLAPVNPAGHLREITVTVERGVETVTYEDGTTANRDRFKASWEGKEGKPVASGKSAVVSLLKEANYGTADDFAFDTDAEFFKAVPRENKPKTIWESDNADKLAQLRNDANAAFEAAEREEITAQEAWRQASVIMNEVAEMLGGAKDFAAFVKGGNGMAEMPFLAKLGTGVNALSEARRLGQLSGFQFAFVPASIMRGKAVQKFVNEGVNDLLSDALESVKTFTGNVEKVSPEMMSDAISQLYARCGVKETVEASDVGAFAAAVKGSAESFGPIWNKVTHTENDRGTAQMLVGAAELVEMVQDYLAAERACDAGEDKALEKRNKNALIKRFATQWEAKGNAKAEEKRVEKVLDAAEDEANEKLDAKTKLKDRAASDVAAQVFNTIKGHPALKEVYRDLGILVGDYLDAIKEAEKEAEAAKEAAE